MLAMSHGVSSVQGGQGWLRSNQGWFGSHLMREEGRNRESKRMELSNQSAGLVNSRNDITQVDVSMQCPGLALEKDERSEVSSSVSDYQAPEHILSEMVPELFLCRNYRRHLQGLARALEWSKEFISSRIYKLECHRAWGSTGGKGNGEDMNDRNSYLGIQREARAKQ